MARPLRARVRKRIAVNQLRERLRGNFASRTISRTAIVAGRNLVNIGGQLYTGAGLENVPAGSIVTVENIGRPAAAVYSAAGARK